MWRCVGLVLTDVSEERIASIFKVAKFASEALALAGGCRLNHQWEITSTGSSIYSHLPMLGLRSRILLPWRWRRYVPPKRWSTQDLHSATSQKTTFFIDTAVKASNLTFKIFVISFPILNDIGIVGFEVFTAFVRKGPIFWNITLCSPFKANRHSRLKCKPRDKLA
jgi:hypothetical protein